MNFQPLNKGDRIFKYTIPDDPLNTIVAVRMHANAEILSVGWQEGHGIQVWARVSQDAIYQSAYEDQKFIVMFTGQKWKGDRIMAWPIGTVTDPEMNLVYHVWVKI